MGKARPTAAGLRNEGAMSQGIQATYRSWEKPQPETSQEKRPQPYCYVDMNSAKHLNESGYGFSPIYTIPLIIYHILLQNSFQVGWCD